MTAQMPPVPEPWHTPAPDAVPSPEPSWPPEAGWQATTAPMPGLATGVPLEAPAGAYTGARYAAAQDATVGYSTAEYPVAEYTPAEYAPAGYAPAEYTPAGYTPAPAEEVPLLTLQDVSAGYGPFRALFEVSFAVPAGTAVALLGPNGAGKTTVARVCSGLVKPASGAVYLGHQDITKMPAHELRRLGISHAPEGRSVFASLTVEENLLLEFRSSLGKTGAPAALERAFAWFPRLEERRTQVAGTLSGGEQRMLSLARVLADLPRLLIVDELSLGLAPIIVDEVFETLKTIRSQGCTLMVIEQHVHKALELADRVVLLQKGRVVYDGPTEDLGDLVHQFFPGL